MIKMARADIEAVMDAAQEAFAQLRPNQRIAHCSAIGSRWKVYSSNFRLRAEEETAPFRKACRWH